MINGLHHTSIVTQDLEPLRRFYRDLIGFEEITDFSWEAGIPEIDEMLKLSGTAATLAMLKAGNTHLELTEFRSPLGRPSSAHPIDEVGYGHFCLDVADFDAEFARLSAAGVEFETPADGDPSVKSAYARDPQGNWFELQQLLDPDSPIAISKGKEAAGVRGLHHTTIVTADPARLLGYYRDVFGFEAVDAPGGDDAPDHLLRAGTMYIEIRGHRSAADPAATGTRPVNDCGIAHFCIDVTDFDYEFQRLSEAGVQFNSPGLSSPPEITPPEFMVKTTYARDPDGNSFEFQEVMDPASPMALPR